MAVKTRMKRTAPVALTFLVILVPIFDSSRKQNGNSSRSQQWPNDLNFSAFSSPSFRIPFSKNLRFLATLFTTRYIGLVDSNTPRLAMIHFKPPRLLWILREIVEGKSIFPLKGYYEKLQANMWLPPWFANLCCACMWRCLDVSPMAVFPYGSYANNANAQHRWPTWLSGRDVAQVVHSLFRSHCFQLYPSQRSQWPELLRVTRHVPEREEYGHKWRDLHDTGGLSFTPRCKRW